MDMAGRDIRVLHRDGFPKADPDYTIQIDVAPGQTGCRTWFPNYQVQPPVAGQLRLRRSGLHPNDRTVTFRPPESVTSARGREMGESSSRNDRGKDRDSKAGS